MKRIFSLLLGILTLQIFIYGQNASIDGKIMHASNSRPLLGVNLTLEVVNQEEVQQWFGITDASGNFRFTGLKGGEYMLYVSHVGFARKVIGISLSDGESASESITLDPEILELGEVKVSSLRKEMTFRNVAAPLAILTEVEIQRNSGFSLADYLSDEPGLSVTSDGIWGTSINVRGLSEQRVVTLIDGNRVETATDLAATLSLVDIENIEQVEVMKGAASSVYGTGAMGGVINIFTKRGHYSQTKKFLGTMRSTYHSVNRLFAEHLSLGASTSNYYVRLSGSFRKADDVTTPEGILENSQFGDRSLSTSMGFRPWKSHELQLSYQYVLATDVGIPGGKVFPGPAEATYPLEKREMISAEYTIKDLLPSLSKASVKYFHQYILRDVLLVPNLPPSTPPGQRITPLEITPTGRHYTNGLHLLTEWQAGSNHEMLIGADLWMRDLRTEREKLIRIEVLDAMNNVIAENTLIKGELPVPESNFTSVGLFLQEEWKMVPERLSLTIGGRVDQIMVSNQEMVDPVYTILNGSLNSEPPNQRIAFPGKNARDFSWSANAGLVFHPESDWDITLSLARSFRSPSLEERYKYIDLGSLVRLGDPELKPEKGYFADLGFRVHKPAFSFSANTFVNSLDDLIVETNGEYIFDYYSAPDVTVTDTLPALINANVDRALLYGFDMKGNIKVAGNLVLELQSAYVRGLDLLNDEELPQISPLNGKLGLRYSSPRWGTIRLSSLLAARQDNIAPGELATGGYARYDVYLQSAPQRFLRTEITLLLAVQNLTDRAYTNHLASNRGFIDVEPGRNFVVKLQLNW